MILKWWKVLTSWLVKPKTNSYEQIDHIEVINQIENEMTQIEETEIANDVIEVESITDSEFDSLYDRLKYKHPFNDESQIEDYNETELINLANLPYTNLYFDDSYMNNVYQLTEYLINEHISNTRFITVLDVGAGTGKLLYILSNFMPDLLFEYTGIDHNSNLYTIANLASKDIDTPKTFYLSSLEQYVKLVPNETKYNLITFIHTFQYDIFNIASKEELSILNDIHYMTNMKSFVLMNLKNYFDLLNEDGLIIITLLTSKNLNYEDATLNTVFKFDVSYLETLKTFIPNCDITYCENFKGMNIDYLLIKKVLNK